MMARRRRSTQSLFNLFAALGLGAGCTLDDGLFELPVGSTGSISGTGSESGSETGGGETGGSESATSGTDGGSGTATGGDVAVCEPEFAKAPRGLTSQQYANTVQDLFAVEYEPVLPQVETAGGFDRVDVAEAVSAYEVAASEVAGLVPVTHLCSAGPNFETCIAELALRVWRRPVEPAELAQLFEAYNTTPGTDELKGRAVMIALLVDPAFYVLAVPETSAGDEPVALDDYALATRLAYYLWNSTPSDELLELAATGALQDPQTLRQTAADMLADPRAQDAVGVMYQQWLNVDDMTPDTVAPDVIPLIPAMQVEVAALASDTILGQSGTLADLLTEPRSIIPAELEPIYADDIVAIPVGLPGEVVFDGSRRGGILTLAGVMAANAGAQASQDWVNWSARGILIRERWLADAIPASPPGLGPMVPPAGEGVTRYDHYGATMSDPTCLGCHTLFDPLTFAFDHYDASGRWTETVLAAPNSTTPTPVDSSGTMTMPMLEFEDNFDLVDQLLAGSELYESAAAQYLAFALREDIAGCALEQMASDFQDSGGDLRELMLDVVTSDAFRFAAP